MLKTVIEFPYSSGWEVERTADLIAAGYQPGNAFDKALDYAHQLQLAGVAQSSTLSQTLVFLRDRES